MPCPCCTSQVRDLQHKVGVMEAQLMEVDDLKRRLGMEQRSATEWKERWNFQVGLGFRGYRGGLSLG